MQTVCFSSFDEMVADGMYELMRNWLLGTWLGKTLNKTFVLANLVLQDEEQDIESRWGRHIKQTDARRFRRITWEQIFEAIRGAEAPNEDKGKMLDYFRNKTRGYDGRRRLVRAFDVD